MAIKKNLLKNWSFPYIQKIRLPFGRIYPIYMREKEQIVSKRLSAEIYLTELNEYRQYLLKLDIKDKEKILTKPLPRFLWIVRSHINGKPVIESVYDGTAVFPERLLTIHFLNPFPGKNFQLA